MRITKIAARLLLSPTRLIIDYLKRPGGPRGAKVLLCWNRTFFWGELVLAAVLSVVSLVRPTWSVPTCVAYLLLGLSYSRCNEIAYAFLRDASDQLDQTPPTTTLTAAQRIKMAMRSYVGLFVNFGVIYYFLPRSLYDPPFKNFVDALYFSGVTLATLGYGDIKPSHFVSQLLSLYEVFSGILLVVVALAVYLANHGKKSA